MMWLACPQEQVFGDERLAATFLDHLSVTGPAARFREVIGRLRQFVTSPTSPPLPLLTSI